MNDLTLIAVSFISGILGLIGIQLLQHNWYRREALKFKFDVKRAKLRKNAFPIKKTSTPSSPSDWLEQLKKINPETLHELIDTFTGGEEIGEGDELTKIITDVAKNNPELVQKFIGNLGKNKEEENKYI
jgi:hypothetical protein